jgi:hypothetical protein
MAMSSPPPASSSKAPEFEPPQVQPHSLSICMCLHGLNPSHLSLSPPQACVNRVIKSVLPDNVQVTKDARAAITRAAGIFIFYLTHW